MKKILTIFFSILINTSLCANQTIKIGASAVPHAEILEFIKPMLKKQGIDLKIIVFQDYVLPNKALDSKDLDANFFQHVQYLNQQKKENGYDFVNLGAVHIEPIGIYSKSYKSLKEVKDGDLVVFSNSVSDRSRILLLLQASKLITLKKNIDPMKLDITDIVSNPKHLKFKNDIDPAFLPRIYFNNEAPLIVINTNYALEARLNPPKDALFLENIKSPYVNIVVTRKDNAQNPNLLKVMQILKSKEVKDFINTKYKGIITPVN